MVKHCGRALWSSTTVVGFYRVIGAVQYGLPESKDRTGSQNRPQPVRSIKIKLQTEAEIDPYCQYRTGIDHKSLVVLKVDL